MRLLRQGIARVLKPGGTHIFTVPYYYWEKTLVRAIKTENGIEFIKPPIYHGNPIDSKGSLVTIDWDYDFVDLIKSYSGMETTILKLRDKKLGLDGEFLEVFMSIKS